MSIPSASQPSITERRKRFGKGNPDGKRGFANYDLSLFKRFLVRERVTFEFRGEFFNAFNYVQLAAPNTAVGSNTFGQISGQANSPRQGQVALKVLF